MPRLCFPPFQIKRNLQYRDAITVCPDLTSIWTKHQVSAGLSEPPALKEQKVWLQEPDSWKLWCFYTNDVCVLRSPSSFCPFDVFTQYFKENSNIHMINTRSLSCFWFLHQSFEIAMFFALLKWAVVQRVGEASDFSRGFFFRCFS